MIATRYSWFLTSRGTPTFTTSHLFLHRAGGAVAAKLHDAGRHAESIAKAKNAAHVLGIQERAAAKRYGRTLERLRELLAEMPGGLTEFRA